ncbi:MAG: GGDEF domain-containing protein [Acidimicrobiales bacterium]
MDPALAVEMVERCLDVTCAIDGEGRITYVSPSVTDALGYEPSDVLGRSFLAFIDPTDVERAMAVYVASRTRSEPDGAANYRLLHADGSWVRFDITGVPLDDTAPHEDFVLQLRRGQDAHLLTQLLEGLLAGADTAEVLAPLVDFGGWRSDQYLCTVVWEDVNGVLRRVGDVVAAEICGLADVDGPWRDALQAGTERIVDAASLDAGLARHARDGDLHTAWIVPVPDRRGRRDAVITVWTRRVGLAVELTASWVRVLRDLVEVILAWRDSLERLEHAARHDDLTRLANRATFAAELAAASGGEKSLLYIDLDGFKPVNDMHGHSTGDLVLRAVAERIRSAVRPGDVVGRVGGDEFAVLCRDCGRHEAAAIADRVLAVLSEPIVVGATTFGITASIGIAAGTDAEDLVDAADQAQLLAKRAGGDTAVVHDAAASDVPSRE